MAASKSGADEQARARPCPRCSQAKLSELQLVFLYRFLQENLLYISTMLAMRLPPLEAPGGTSAAPGDPAAAPEAPEEASPFKAGAAAGGGRAASSPSKAAGGSGADQQPEQEQQEEAATSVQPMLLLLDVEMEAPVICMPRNTGGDGFISRCVVRERERALC